MSRRDAINGARRGVRKTYTEDELSTILQAENRVKSLRAIARDRYNDQITHGVIQRAIKGEYPTDPVKREILGLAIYRPAPACPACGLVHVTRRCPNKAKKKAPRRVAIRCDDMDSAARTIFRNLEYSQVQELTELLVTGLAVGVLKSIFNKESVTNE